MWRMRGSGRRRPEVRLTKLSHRCSTAQVRRWLTMQRSSEPLPYVALALIAAAPLTNSVSRSGAFPPGPSARTSSGTARTPCDDGCGGVDVGQQVIQHVRQSERSTGDGAGRRSAELLGAVSWRRATIGRHRK